MCTKYKSLSRIWPQFKHILTIKTRCAIHTCLINLVQSHYSIPMPVSSFRSCLLSVRLTIGLFDGLSEGLGGGINSGGVSRTQSHLHLKRYNLETVPEVRKHIPGMAFEQLGLTFGFTCYGNALIL